MGRFFEVCRRRGLKVSAGKRKVMVLNGEEGLECEFRVDGMRLEHVVGFKYLRCALGISGVVEAECRRKVVTGLQGAVRSLVKSRDLQLEFARVLLESSIVSVFMYASETMIWKMKKRSRIRAL